MSRSMKPYEIYMFDKTYPGVMISNATYILSEGKTYKYFSDEEQSIRLQYPLFATIYTDFIKFYKYIKKNRSDYKETIIKIENMIRNMVEDAEKNDYDIKKLNNHPEKMVLWFFGCLDPQFYTSDENNELFFQYLKEYSETL